MATSKELISAMGKKFGEGIITQGVTYTESGRATAGLFPFDLATGGGFPRGKLSIVYGPEASLKTTLTLLAIAQEQKLNPTQKCVFVDIENSYDSERAEQLGVDNKELIYVLPDFAEQVVDIVESFMYADDVTMIVIDSLAAMITYNEQDSSADKAVVGGAGLVIGKLYRKITLAHNRTKRVGRYPTVIAINQIRMKIGVMHGNPEVMPGGNAFKFASALTIRMYGKNIIDKKIDPELASWSECSGIIQKYKVPIVSRVFKFQMAIIPHKTLKIGEVYEWPTVINYLKDTGLMTKDNAAKEWVLFGEGYKTQAAIKQRMEDDFDYRTVVKDAIIQAVVNPDNTQDDEEVKEDVDNSDLLVDEDDI